MTTKQLTFNDLPEAVHFLSREVLDLKDMIRPLIANPGNDNTEKKPINLAQTALFLDISEQTVYQNIKKIPHHKRFGRLYFFESELLNYIKGETV